MRGFKYGECVCGRALTKDAANCPYCKRKLRDKNHFRGGRGGGAKKKLPFIKDGVLGFTCATCKLHLDTTKFISGKTNCGKCNSKRGRDRKKDGSVIKKFHTESIQCDNHDYYAQGFEAALESDSKYPQGSLMWYFFHEGFMEKRKQPEPYAFKRYPEDEPYNKTGMSGQRVSTFSRRAKKRYPSTAKIYADDEFYADCELTIPHVLEDWQAGLEDTDQVYLLM